MCYRGTSRVSTYEELFLEALHSGDAFINSSLFIISNCLVATKTDVLSMILEGRSCHGKSLPIIIVGQNLSKGFRTDT